MRALASLVPVSLTALCTAQTYVVDAAGGPGSHFTDIDAAVSAVPDGATLLVRPGVYGSAYQGPVFTIDGKGLSVIGETGATINTQILIQNTTASQSVSIRNIACPAGFWCTDCDGQVLIDSVQNAIGVGGSSLYFRLQATNCERLTAVGTTFAVAVLGGPPSYAVSATNSRIAMHDCLLSGINQPAVGLVASDLQAVDCQFVYFGGSTNTIQADTNSSMRLLGQTNVGGQQGPPIVGGVVRLGPDVQLIGTPTPIQAISVTQVPDELVRVTGGAIGDTLTATLTGRTGSISLLVLGMPGQAFTIPGVVDAWWLDPFVADGVAAGILNGPLVAGIPIPGTPSLQGLSYGFQGFYLDAVHGLSASAPRPFVLF